MPFPLSEEALKEIVEQAGDSFWATIACSFPEVKTGDFDPVASITFSTACIVAVKQWLSLNHPFYGNR